MLVGEVAAGKVTCACASRQTGANAFYFIGSDGEIAWLNIYDGVEGSLVTLKVVTV